MVVAPVSVTEGDESIAIVVINHEDGFDSRFYLDKLLQRKSLREIQTAQGGLPGGQLHDTTSVSEVNSDLQSLLVNYFSLKDVIRKPWTRTGNRLL